MNVRVATRKKDGTVNIVDISDVESFNEARELAMKELDAVTAIAIELNPTIKVIS